MNNSCPIDFSLGTGSETPEPVPNEKNLKIRVLPYFMWVPSVFLPFTSCTCASEHVPNKHKITEPLQGKRLRPFLCVIQFFVFFVVFCYPFTYWEISSQMPDFSNPSFHAAAPARSYSCITLSFASRDCSSSSHILYVFPSAVHSA